MEGPQPRVEAQSSEVLRVCAQAGAGARLGAEVEEMVGRWGQLAELLASASPSAGAHRWQHALSSLCSTARAVFAASLMANRARGPGKSVAEEVNLAVLVMDGAARYAMVRTLAAGGLRAVGSSWRIESARVLDAEARLGLVAGNPVVFGSGRVGAVDLQGCIGPAHPFPLSTLLFGAALGAGWPWAQSLALFTGLRCGWPTEGGRGFIPERGKLVLANRGRGIRWLCGELTSKMDPAAVVTIFFDTSGIVFVRCTRVIFRLGGRAGGMGNGPPRSRTRFMPEFVRLPVGPDGDFHRQSPAV